MIIVVEGADNSGKSSLIAYLAAKTGLSYVPGEGRRKSAEEINERVDRYLKMDNVIFDRHTCVSNAMYDAWRKNKMGVTPDRISAFYDTNALFIYCTSDGSLSDHQRRPDVDSDEHMALVNGNHHDICKAYDEWAIHNANWFYRKGRTSMDNIAFMIQAIMAQHGIGFYITDVVGDVEQFHAKFGLPMTRQPVESLDVEVNKFRQNFMGEELKEYNDAWLEIIDMQSASVLHHDPDEYTDLLEAQLDALIDLVYVAIGTALFHGFDFRAGWRRVQLANMMKVRAQHDGSDSKRKSSFDVVKPKGWERPVHTDLVANNDFDTRFKVKS